MKINASLENCRRLLCEIAETAPPTPNRAKVIRAIEELDSFRHGKFQDCEKCGYEEKTDVGP